VLAAGARVSYLGAVWGSLSPQAVSAQTRLQLMDDFDALDVEDDDDMFTYMPPRPTAPAPAPAPAPAGAPPASSLATSPYDETDVADTAYVRWPYLLRILARARVSSRLTARSSPPSNPKPS
jgi:hypothetical protein